MEYATLNTPVPGGKVRLTTHECCEIMRENGIPCSERRLRNDIESGAYDFGRVTSTGRVGRRSIEIFAVDFYRWLNSKRYIAASAGGEK